MRRFTIIPGFWPVTATGVLIIAALLVFYGMLDHQFLPNWDDDLYVSENLCIRGFSLINLQCAFSRTFVGNYAPVQMLSYMFDYELWGLSPRGFLVTNLLLHIMTGVLLWRLAIRTGATEAGALAAALLFLVHQLQVESVAWVSQRKTLLCAFFFFSSLHVWRSWRQLGGRWRFNLSLIFFILSLLSKSLAVVLPFVLLLHDRLLLGVRDRLSLFRPLIPFFAAACVAGLIAMSTQESWEGGGRASWHGGNPWATFWTMLPVYARYLALLLWPAQLSAFYYQPVRSGPDWVSAGALALIAVLAVLLVRLSKRNPQAGFWGGFALLGFLPVAQIVPLVTLMNDRYLYLPLAGVAGLFGWAVGRGAMMDNVLLRRLFLCTIAGVILTLATRAHHRVPVWRDSFTLWSDAAAKEPDAGMPWLELAGLHYKAGRYGEAWNYYRHLHALNLKQKGRDEGMGDLMLALALKLAEEGDLQGAEKTALDSFSAADDGDLRPLRLLADIRKRKGDAAAGRELQDLARRLEAKEAGD